MIRKFLILPLLLFFIVPSTFAGKQKKIEKFYDEWESEEEIPQEALLEKKEEPVVYYNGDGYNLIEFLQNNYCKIVGVADWDVDYGKPLGKHNTKWHKGIVAFAKKHHQKIAFVESTGGEKTTFYKTTNTNSGFGDSLFGTASVFSGTSTSTTKPITTQEFTHSVYLLRPYTEEELAEMKFGITYRSLLDEEQKMLGRNTGVCVLTTLKEFPAFYAEIYRGDIIIQMNDTKIRSEKDLNAFQSKSQTGDVIKVTLLRGGVEKVIDMEI